MPWNTHGLPRSIRLSNQRWKEHILPILKTYSLQLPGFPNNYYLWKNNLLTHIVSEKVDSVDNLDFEYLLDHVCRGQTKTSIRYFLKYYTCSKEPLHLACLKKLNNPRGYRTNLKWVKDIVKIYKNIMN